MEDEAKKKAEELFEKYGYLAIDVTKEITSLPMKNKEEWNDKYDYWNMVQREIECREFTPKLLKPPKEKALELWETAMLLVKDSKNSLNIKECLMQTIDKIIEVSDVSQHWMYWAEVKEELEILFK